MKFPGSPDEVRVRMFGHAALYPLHDSAAVAPADDGTWLAAHFPFVRALAAATLRMPLDHPDVQDCASESLKRAMEGRARLTPGRPVRAWLTGVTRHVALDMIRAKARAKARTAEVRASDSSPELPVDRVEDRAPDPETGALAKESMTQLQTALADLPDRQREALLLFCVDGLGYDAIATRMNTPLGTIATWITRARKAVAQSLAYGEA